MPRPTALILLCLVALCLWTPATSTAEGVAPESRGPTAEPDTTASIGLLSRHMSHEMGLAGHESGAYVEDLSTDQVLFSDHATVMRAPASVEKLYTATAALEKLGPEARLETTVLGTGRLAPGGVWEGNLYLHGGGDPTFGSRAFIRSHYGGVGTSVESLAAQLERYGIKRVTGKIEGDESYFDSLRGEPSSDFQFDPFLEGTLSALAFNRGESGDLRGPHAPAAWAAHELWESLRSDHVSAPEGSGAATAPPAARRLVGVKSPTVAELLGIMLPPSDNFFAETLVKVLGARFGSGGTTAAGASVVEQALRTLELDPHVVDGSGLSRADHTSPKEVVALLGDLSLTQTGELLRKDLAVAGRTGTLEERMRHTRAAGNCQAKTGTLSGASNLAGYCEARNGHLLAFAFFNDAISTTAAHKIQDNMAITLADY